MNAIVIFSLLIAVGAAGELLAVRFYNRKSDGVPRAALSNGDSGVHHLSDKDPTAKQQIVEKRK